MRPALALALLAVLPAAGHSPARPPACRAAQFRAGTGPEVGEATGRHTLVLRLVNRGRPCTLAGYPSIRLADAAGAIPFRYRHGGDQMLAPRPPRRFRVAARGGVAYVLLDHYRCDLGDRRSASRVRIGFPGLGAGGVKVSIRRALSRVAWCGPDDPGSTVTVSPFVPTVGAALRG